jgi:chromosome segregation protein
MRMRKERLLIDMQRFGEDSKEAEEIKVSLREQLFSLEAEQATSKERVSVLSMSMQRFREALVESDRGLEEAKNALSQGRGRLRGLEEVHARLEGVGAGVRALVASQDPCILGLVADLIEASDQALVPFAAVLGSRLQAVVVDDLERSSVLFEELGKRKAGRATMIHAYPSFAGVSYSPEVLGQVGLLGPLPCFLRFSSEYEGLVRSMVGGTLLVEDRQTVSRLRAIGFRGQIVTLDGEVHHGDGSLSGGAGEDVALGLLRQKQQIRQMSERVLEEEKRVEELLFSHGQLRDQLKEAGELLEEARVSEREAQLEKVTLESELHRAEDRLKSVSSRLMEIDKESEELEARLDEAGFARDEAERVLEESKTRAKVASEALQEAEEQARLWMDRVSEQKEACTERKVEFVRIREQATSARATQDRLSRSVVELGDRAQALDQEVVASSVEQGQLAAQLFEFRARSLEASEAARSAHLEFDRRRQALDGARNALAIHEAELKTLRDKLEERMELQRQHEMALQKLQLEREHLIEGVAEKFRGLRLPRIVGDYHLRPPPDSDHRARIDELSTLIERMGPVNLDAMEEFEKTSERFEFYTTQKADLENAL